MADSAGSAPHGPLDGPTSSIMKPGFESHNPKPTDSPSELARGRNESEYPIAPWDICWHDKPRTAVSLFLIGLICAIGQHFFYSMKNGTLAEQQEWTLRIGTGLAYLLGFSMAALVGISRDQWVWRTLRTRFFPLKSIDALFGVTTNVFCFLDFNMVCNAKVSTMLAVLKWLFPLVTIFTPSTISVVLRPVESQFQCNVPTLLFPGAYNGSTGISAANAQSHDLIYGNYTGGGDAEDGAGSKKKRAAAVSRSGNVLSQQFGPDSESMSNSAYTARATYQLVDSYNPSLYTDRNVSVDGRLLSIDAESKDCYVSSEVLRYFLLSAYSSEVIFPPPKPGHELISKECSVNCTYSYEFVGPSVECTEFETFPEVFSKIYKGISDKNIILFGAGQGSDLGSSATDAGSTAADDMLYSSERLWAFYSVANDSRVARDDRSLHAYSCGFGPARYQITQSISDRFLPPKIKVDPVSKDKVGLDTKATCALQQSLRQILGGYLIVTHPPPLLNQTQEGNYSYTVTVPIASNRTNIRSTNLMNETSLNVKHPLGSHIESMAQKMVVSLIADDGLILAGRVNTTCRAIKMQNTYVYKPLILLLVNTTAMFFSALVAVLGALALVENGVASDTSFSTFLRTTRNPTLDEKLRGGSLGGSSMTEKFSNIKLKYGELSVGGVGANGNGPIHVGMGVEGEVNTMTKGKNYY